MQREGIGPHLWLTNHPEKPKVIVKPTSPYVLIAREFNTFCSRLEKLKVPSGYCSKLGMAIKKKKFGTLKTHDYHILMQQLLPYALRGLMEQNTRLAIMRSSRLFQRLYYKTWDPLQRQNFEDDVAITMAMMDMTFPPSFFDVMSHMPYHLVEQLSMCGPNHVR